MKFQLFALLLAVAGAYAIPAQHSGVEVVDSPNAPAPRFIVENQIRRIIQLISDAIKDFGLDPLIIDNEEFVFHPIPLLVEINVLIDNLRFEGASNIRIHSLDYNLVLNRLRFDISLPELRWSVRDSVIEGIAFDNVIEGQFKGRLVISSIRLSGEVRVNVGIIGGISLRSVSLNFSLGGIRSDLFLSAQGNDYSDILNDYLNEKIPNALEENRAAINKLLEDIFRAVFDLVS